MYTVICTTKDAFELDAFITFSKEQGRGTKKKKEVGPLCTVISVSALSLVTSVGSLVSCRFRDRFS